MMRSKKGVLEVMLGVKKKESPRTFNVGASIQTKFRRLGRQGYLVKSRRQRAEGTPSYTTARHST